MTIWAHSWSARAHPNLARLPLGSQIFPLNIQQGVLDKGEMLMTGIPRLFRLPGQDRRNQVRPMAADPVNYARALVQHLDVAQDIALQQGA